MSDPIYSPIARMLGLHPAALAQRAANARTRDEAVMPDVNAIAKNLDPIGHQALAQNIEDYCGPDEKWAEDNEISGEPRTVNARTKLPENNIGDKEAGDKNPDGNPDHSDQDDDAKSLDAKDDDADGEGSIDIDAKVKTLTARMCEACASAYKNRGESNDLTGVCGECRANAVKAVKLARQRKSAHSRSFVYGA